MIKNFGWIDSFTNLGLCKKKQLSHNFFLWFLPKKCRQSNNVQIRLKWRFPNSQIQWMNIINTLLSLSTISYQPFNLICHQGQPNLLFYLRNKLILEKIRCMYTRKYLWVSKSKWAGHGMHFLFSFKAVWQRVDNAFTHLLLFSLFRKLNERTSRFHARVYIFM